MCREAHLACNYSREGALLQSSHEQAVTLVPLTAPQYSNNQAALGLINGILLEHHSNSSETGHVYQLSLEDLSLLLRFQNRTVRSLGAQWDLIIWEKELIRLVSLVSSLCCA